MRIINWMKVARFACARVARQQRDDIGRFYALRELAAILRPDYRFKWPSVDWWRDADFTNYLQRFGELGGMNTDRRWMLHQLLRLVDTVPGDTAECGVFRGASSYLICRANSASGCAGKWHHMFDSFEGLSAPRAVDGQHWTAGDLRCGLDAAQRNLAEFADAQFYPGWIPDRFGEVADRSFSFVHIDVDLYEPTRDSMAFFYPRLNDGGVLLCDDYAVKTCPGATRAVDEFLQDKPEQMIHLSAGAGFLIKGCPVAARHSVTGPLARRSPLPSTETLTSGEWLAGQVRER